MTARRQQKRLMAEINVVPYIDVTLVLLIIFMITAPLLQTGVEVDLPRAEAKTVKQDNDPPLVVSIDAEGNYYVDVGENPNDPIEPEVLYVRVAAVLRHKPQTAVLVSGDQAVDYGKVVTVMAGLKEAGVGSVGLLTKPMNQ